MTEQVSETDQVNSIANEVFEGIATKWALLIIDALGTETLRFGELRTQVEGISHKMLAQTLRTLEQNGIVSRLAHATVPPRVDYSLTAAGIELQAVVHGICGWTRGHLPEIRMARERFVDRN